MPALPTTNLTLHLDASDDDNLFTTFDGSGVHTGTPIDGSSVQVWDDEGDGIADVILAANNTSQSPIYQVTTPLMLHPCLRFTDAPYLMLSATQTYSANRAASDFMTVNAFTMLVACYPESITLNEAASYNNHFLVGEAGNLAGISFKNVSGQRKALFHNWDGNDDSIEFDINENTSYVFMFRHESGNIYASVNGGSESSAPSGSTTALSSALGIGQYPYYTGRIGEIAIYNAALSGADLSDAIQYFTDKWLAAAIDVSQFRRRPPR